jgi:hypothetical protein
VLETIQVWETPICVVVNPVADKEAFDPIHIDAPPTAVGTAGADEHCGAAVTARV